jgi:predicted dehydrogenase
MIGIGFIGVGGMGRQQVRSFLQVPGCRIAAGSDVSERARAEFAKIAPDARAYQSHVELLADRNVDTVVVAVPTGFHKSITLDALAAGRDVLLEKPMARTVVECRELIDAAEKHKRLLMVAHCRRFDSDWGVFADAYRSGKLGPSVLWRLVRGGVPSARWFMDDATGGGPLFDAAIHNYDFANYLFGPADSAFGNSIKFDPTCTAIDTGNVVVQYRNGSQLLLSWSWSVHAAFLHDCLGDKSTFIFNTTKNEHQLIDRAGNKTPLPFEPTDMYVTQAEHFLDCVNGAADCKSPASEAIKAVAVAEAVLDACRPPSAMIAIADL